MISVVRELKVIIYVCTSCQTAARRDNHKELSWFLYSSRTNRLIFGSQERDKEQDQMCHCNVKADFTCRIPLQIWISVKVKPIHDILSSSAAWTCQVNLASNCDGTTKHNEKKCKMICFNRVWWRTQHPKTFPGFMCLQLFIYCEWTLHQIDTSTKL